MSMASTTPASLESTGDDDITSPDTFKGVCWELQPTLYCVGRDDDDQAVSLAVKVTWDTPQRTRLWQGCQVPLHPEVLSRRRREMTDHSDKTIVPAWLEEVSKGLCEQLIQQIRDESVRYDDASGKPLSWVSASEWQDIVDGASRSTAASLNPIRLSREMKGKVTFKPLRIQQKTAEQPIPTARAREYSHREALTGHADFSGVETSFTGGGMFRTQGSDVVHGMWKLEQYLLPVVQQPVEGSAAPMLPSNCTSEPSCLSQGTEPQQSNADSEPGYRESIFRDSLHDNEHVVLDGDGELDQWIDFDGGC